MLTVTLWLVHPSDRLMRRPKALCVGSVTYSPGTHVSGRYCSCPPCLREEHRAASEWG